MRIIGIDKLHRGIRSFSNLFQNRAVILLYHRIAELQPDPQLLCVTPAHFAEHLKHLRQYYKPISLQALKQALIDGHVPHKAVVITFDDGYADNLWNAKSLLECYNIPATVFVTSGYVDNDREFSSDVLERCLLRPRTLPNSLTLSIEGKTYSWQIYDIKNNVGGAWDVTMGFDPTPRHRCYRELHRILRPLNDASRQTVLEALANWASCSTNARLDRRALNSDELKSLSEDGLVEIGAHGVSHLLLAEQSSEVQWKEISKSKQHLEEILKRHVTSFCYPYGGLDDVNKHTIDLVKKAGFDVACANVHSSVTAHSDLFWQSRFLVRDWSSQEFAKRIRVFFGE